MLQEVAVPHPPSPVALRAARPGDGAALVEIFREAIAAEAPTRYTADQTRAWASRGSAAAFERRLSVSQFVVAEAPSGGIVGFAALNLATAELEYAYVRPSCLRSGIGRRLVEGLEARAREAGLSAISLVASLNAEAFYHRVGFASVRRRTRRVEGVAVPCVVMSKRLA